MERGSSCTTILIMFLGLGMIVSSATACSGNSDSAEAEDAAVADSEARPGPADPAAQNADVEAYPEVVARVSDEEITKVDLLRRATAVQARMQVSETTDDFYRMVLEELIGARLLLQASTAKGLAPSENEVKAQLDSVRSRFPSPEQFMEGLSSQGLTLEDLQSMIATDLAIENFIQAEIVPRAEVTEEAKQRFYDENADQMKRPEQAKLSHILVQVDADSAAEAREDALEKAEDLHQRLQEGEDFAKLAGENSDDPGSRTRGGDLDWVSRGQTVPAFEEAAFQLKPGEISEVVETEFGYHIIKLAERRPGGLMAYEEVEGRIEEFLSQQRLQEEIQAEVDALKAKADVEIFL